VKVNPAATSTIAIISTVSPVAPDMLTVANGAEVDLGDPSPVAAPVPLEVSIVLAVRAPVAKLVVVVFGVLTKNQSAATGSPNPTSATKLVRLNPIRLNGLSGEAVKLTKKGR
jgi:hypothetical protein